MSDSFHVMKGAEVAELRFQAVPSGPAIWVSAGSRLIEQALQVFMRSNFVQQYGCILQAPKSSQQLLPC